MTTQRYIQVPEMTALSNELRDALAVLLPDWTPRDSSPVTYWSDVTAVKLIEYLNQVNTAADANWIETATGDALVQLLRNVGLSPSPGETDPDARQRYYDAWTALAKDTPEYARLLARQASALVADSALSFDVNTNTATLYLVDDAGNDVGASTRAAVQLYVNQPSRRPFWIDYATAEATVTAYSVDAAITYARHLPSPEAQVRRNLAATLVALRGLNTAIYQSALVEGAWASGVVNIAVSAPSAALPASPGIIYHGAIGTLTFTEATA